MYTAAAVSIHGKRYGLAGEKKAEHPAYKVLTIYVMLQN